MQTAAINNNIIFNANHGTLNSSAKNPKTPDTTVEKNTTSLLSSYESVISKALRFQDSEDGIVQQARNAIAQNQLSTLDNMTIAAECILNFGI